MPCAKQSMLAALASLFITATSHAETYPKQPVRLVVPFAAGGSVDNLARVIGSGLSEIWGQPVVIENKPGAGGNLGTDTAAKSPPDGYTILLTTNGHAISPSMYRMLPFDPVEDFIPVTQLIESPLVLVASNKTPVANLKELIVLSKDRAGSLNYGMSGIGNPLHLSMEILKKEAGMSIQAVPYRGDAPLNSALIAGEIQVAIVPIATGRTNVDNKLYKALAVTSAARSKMMPQIPTIAEQGVENFDISSWQGLFVPAKTPKGIVDKIYRDTKKVLNSKETQERLQAFAADSVASTPEEFARRYNDDLLKFKKIINDAKIPIQE